MLRRLLSEYWRKETEKSKVFCGVVGLDGRCSAQAEQRKKPVAVVHLPGAYLSTETNLVPIRGVMRKEFDTGQTDRQTHTHTQTHGMKTATHGADEGRLDLQKSVLTSRRQKFCESATARPHDGAVKWGQRLPNSRFVPSPRCSNKITILCKHIEACSCTSYCDMHVPVRALANCSHHSSIVHCLHPVTSCKACRCAFYQRSVGI